MGESTTWNDKHGAKWVDKDADATVPQIGDRKTRVISVFQLVGVNQQGYYETFYPENSKPMRDAAIAKLQEMMRLTRMSARKGRPLTPVEKLMAKKVKD